MLLNEEAEAMLSGAAGPARRWAVEHLVCVGRFFDAPDLVPVSQAHLMADTEALGESGVVFLEKMASLPPGQRRLRIPTTSDPRGADFRAYARIRQDEAFVALERRADAAFRALGMLMTDTCINYQTILPPVLGEHVAYGDTGTVIYANSVLGARSNYEGGPSALASALTGYAPRYGFHLDARRRGTRLFELDCRPGDLSGWGALGAIVGRAMDSYWDVPVIAGVDAAPGSDALKHFGAALASFGSTALFHMPGVTPEAPDVAAAFDGPAPAPVRVAEADIEAFRRSYRPADDRLDLVVFAAPQLSLVEMRDLAGLMEGRRLSPRTALLVCTSPAVAADARRLGFVDAIEAAGGVFLEGVCFYQMHAREIGEANGWRRLMTNSAKLANIIAGYGYEPVLASMAECIDGAVAGRLPWPAS